LKFHVMVVSLGGHALVHWMVPGSVMLEGHTGTRTSGVVTERRSVGDIQSERARERERERERERVSE